MNSRVDRLRTNLRTRQFVLAGIVMSVSVVLGLSDWWVFRKSQAQPRTSLWQLILSDRWTLGFVRLAVFLLAVYTIASVVALITAGRWIKGLGTGGFSADDEIAPVVAARSEVEEAKDLIEEAWVELRKRRE